MSALTKETVEEWRGKPLSGVEAEFVINSHEALRAALTQGAADLKVMEHKVIACGVAAHHPDPELTHTYPAEWQSPQLTDVRNLRAKVARLERTVEQMRPVFEASLMYHRKPMDMSRNWGDVWSAAVDDALKAASSPDHAGAPEDRP